MENKKNKLWLGILIGILVSVIIGLTGFIIYDKINMNNNTTTNTNNNNDNNKNNSNLEEIKPIDLSKCLNCPGDTSFSDLDTIDSDIGVSIQINSDKKGAKLIINNSKFSNSAINFGVYGGEVTTFEFSGFSKTIVSSYIGNTGQDITGTVFIFVLEDGSIDYAYLYELCSNKDGSGTYYDFSWNSKDNNGSIKVKNLPTIKNIVSVHIANRTTGMFGGIDTLLALKDGSFYTLSYSLK